MGENVFERMEKAIGQGTGMMLTAEEIELPYEICGEALEQAKLEVSPSIGQEFASRWMENCHQPHRRRMLTSEQIRQQIADATDEFVKTKPRKHHPYIREVALEALDKGDENCFREVSIDGVSTIIRARELLEFRKLLWVGAATAGAVQIFRLPVSHRKT